MSTYCGTGKPKKGQKLGNMKECAESKQIRRFGLFKVDSLVEKSIQDQKANRKKKEDLMLKKFTLEGKLKNLKGKLQNAKTSTDKKEVKKEIDTIMKKKTELISKLKKL
jgi:hypothetical protein